MPELTPEAREARAAYMREWRKKNAEKTKEYNARKWERKAAAQKDAQTGKAEANAAERV